MATRDSSHTPIDPPAPRLLSDEQRLNWLRLIRTRNIGPVTFQRLINHYGGAARALEYLSERAQLAGKTSQIPVTAQMVERELRAARKCGATLVAKGETGYPTELVRVDAPPPLLYIKGNAELAAQPSVAIVGSRNASAIGQKFTRRLVQDLAKEGYAIVSGLARGIDTAAHEGAGAHATITIIAGGINNYYPPQNKQLQQQIEQNGLVISENPPGYEPRAQDFPRRNRIISGCTLGTIVVEANLRSGSLITARLANEQGREVMAVPGHPFDPRAAGPNRLIRDGATLITCARQVIEDLTPMSTIRHHKQPSLFENNKTQQEIEDLQIDRNTTEKVFDALSVHPVAIDDIIRATDLPARIVIAALTELKLDGLTQNEGAQMVRLSPPEAKK